MMMSSTTTSGSSDAGTGNNMAAQQEPTKTTAGNDASIVNPPQQRTKKKNDWTTTCHSLPCKVDFSGRAPVDVYFQPRLVVGDDDDVEDITTTTVDTTNHNDDNNKGGQGGGEAMDNASASIDDDNYNRGRVYASQFRGRQLLAAEPYQHCSITVNNNNGTTSAVSKTTTGVVPKPTIQGRVFEIDTGKPRTSRERVQVKGTFSSILEWKHESEPAVIRNFSAEDRRKSRVAAALEWCDVANALHDPIPLPTS